VGHGEDSWSIWRITWTSSYGVASCCADLLTGVEQQVTVQFHCVPIGPPSATLPPGQGCVCVCVCVYLAPWKMPHSSAGYTPCHGKHRWTQVPFCPLYDFPIFCLWFPATFFRPGVWTQTRHSAIRHTSSTFCSGYFGDGVSETICPDWPQTAVLSISASQVARTTGMSHRCPFSSLLILHPSSFSGRTQKASHVLQQIASVFKNRFRCLNLVATGELKEWKDNLNVSCGDSHL
jgi:hypothetical protein